MLGQGSYIGQIKQDKVKEQSLNCQRNKQIFGRLAKKQGIWSHLLLDGFFKFKDGNTTFMEMFFQICLRN